MTKYHYVYKNGNNDTCFTWIDADDLDQAWDFFRHEYNPTTDQVLMIFVGSVDQILYQE